MYVCRVPCSTGAPEIVVFACIVMMSIATATDQQTVYVRSAMLALQGQIRYVLNGARTGNRGCNLQNELISEDVLVDSLFPLAWIDRNRDLPHLPGCRKVQARKNYLSTDNGFVLPCAVLCRVRLWCFSVFNFILFHFI